MRNPVYATIISSSIIRLHKEYPGLPIGEHIAHALDGGDIYNISDREFAEALTNYLTELELDSAFQSEDSPDEYNE
jgi:hypothetical protein